MEEFFLVYFASCVVNLPAYWVMRKAGWSGWAFLILGIPLFGFLLLYVFSFREWPARPVNRSRFQIQTTTENFNKYLPVVLIIMNIFIGTLQLMAIFSALEHWMNLHWIPAGILALLIGYMPIIGTILGIVGAVEAWEWSWLQASALFFGPFALIGMTALFFSGLEALNKRS